MDLVTYLADDNITSGHIHASRVENIAAGTAATGRDINIIYHIKGIIFCVKKNDGVCTQVNDREEAADGVEVCLVWMGSCLAPFLGTQFTRR